MKLIDGKFTVSYADNAAAPVTLEKDALVIGRLQSCDVILNHSSVSRIHAGINLIDSEYYLINLSTSNSLTLNGHLLSAEESDVLADGDIIQIGPFTMNVDRNDNELKLAVVHQFAGKVGDSTGRLPALSQIVPTRNKQESAGVLKVFWEKRTREKEDWGTRLRPTAKPQPGKALINWKPTNDLRRPWQIGLFIWAFLIFGVLAVVAFYRFPQTYVSKPLSNPHIKKIDSNMIANRGNENSCLTCHSLTEPMENACIKCHQAEQFHASNTNAHQNAGVTCTVCHGEHQGESFEPGSDAVRGCAECHSDNNKTLYNGITVKTAHGGVFGRPTNGGKWVWKGLYTEIAEAIKTTNASPDKGETEQMRLSRQFHAVHISRLNPAPGMKTDASNRVSCSTCHTSFEPVDLASPYETCAACHNGWRDGKSEKVLISDDQSNCVSCHVQHPFSVNRWSEFLTEDARSAREKVIADQIKRVKEK